MFRSNCCTTIPPPSRSASHALNALLALLFLAGIASATAINPTSVDNTRGENLWIDENGTPTQTYFTGVIDILLTDDHNKTYSRDTLCVDLFTEIFIGVNYSTVVMSPSEVPNVNTAHLERVAWLIDNELPAVNSALHPGDPNYGQAAAMGAGLQLAIWDITVDGGNGLSSGSVQAVTSATPGATPDKFTDPLAASWATTFEGASVGKSSNLAFVYVNASLGYNTPVGAPAQMLEGPEFQDHGPEPDPEPSTFALGLGALLIGIARIFRPRLRT